MWFLNSKVSLLCYVVFKRPYRWGLHHAVIAFLANQSLKLVLVHTYIEMVLFSTFWEFYIVVKKSIFLIRQLVNHFVWQWKSFWHYSENFTSQITQNTVLLGLLPQVSFSLKWKHFSSLAVKVYLFKIQHVRLNELFLVIWGYVNDLRSQQ